MKYLVLIAIFLSNISKSFCQKLIIDSLACAQWHTPPNILDIQISDDGNYVTYNTNDPSAGGQVLTVQATHKNWKMKFPGRCCGHITADSKWVIFQGTGDSCCRLRLGSSQIKWIVGVKSFNLLTANNTEWVAYESSLAGREKELVLKDLKTGRERSIKEASDYLFYPRYNSLLIFKSGESKDNLEWIDLTTWERKVIWQGDKILTYSYDLQSGQIVIISQDRLNDPLTRALWYYKANMAQSVELINRSNLADSSLIIDSGRPIFGKGGSQIFFNFSQRPVLSKLIDPISVDLWSYRDVVLQEEQIYEEKLNGVRPRKYRAVVDPVSKNMLQLEDEDWKTYFDEEFSQRNNFMILTKGKVSGDFWWRDNAHLSVCLMSIKDRTKVLLREKIEYNLAGNLKFLLSPNEKFILYYDPIKRTYFSCDLEKRITRAINKGSYISWKREINNEMADPQYADPVGIAGWMNDGRSVLLYDRNDIWRLDLAGIRPPENITHGFGLTHHLQFRLAQEDADPIFEEGAKLLLTGFDSATKYSGFYTQTLGGKESPTELTMGPYRYSYPQKAKKADTWVVIRESAVEFPNFYTTTDFKNFRPLSEIYPQKKYNWLTAELVRWRMTDGEGSQGILYKPEDFDPTRKYPLLLNFYEERSEELYMYRQPAITGTNINIPYFVNRDYLVFIPDIHFKNGVTPGEGAMNAVVSSARYLSRNSWVDSNRIGIHGHSFGGGEVNYLVTHTNLFAAAAEVAGPTDAISAYGGLLGAGGGRQFLYEMSQSRIRATPWQRPDLYIRETIVLQADQVTTPLLMMHNKMDGNVPWGQAVEFFTALRRLGKRAWLLQYDHAGHGVGGLQAMDYTIRLGQFFDHYLKGALPPKWMTEGIPAIKKGIERGYKLDSSGRQP